MRLTSLRIRGSSERGRAIGYCERRILFYGMDDGGAMGGLEGGGFQRSLLPLFPTFIATQDPSPLPSLAASLWLFSSSGMGPFLVIPASELICLACLFLLQLSPLAVAPFLLPGSFRGWLKGLPSPCGSSLACCAPLGMPPCCLALTPTSRGVLWRFPLWVFRPTILASSSCA